MRTIPSRENSAVYDLIRDLKYTLRRLARTPVFTLATTATFAMTARTKGAGHDLLAVAIVELGNVPDGRRTRRNRNPVP